MNFLCPSCRTPLPRAGPEHVTCTGCGVAVDLTRMDTAPGQARLWPEIDLSGETLSGYALLRLLGSGGMGSVYEARGADGSIVALKVLSPLLAAEPALRERFRREARALSALSHPGVVKMLGEGEEHSFCWYAMERVVGPDLRERLKRGPLPVPEVIALGQTMLEALEVVHAGGFVHRDVKPSNILLSPEGPKLCDFGIARFEGASTLTESAALLGSLRYMAPEQRWGKSDARSDLYALGVVLHEALALGVPGERTLPPGTPATLARVIARLTQTSPVLRPQSAAAAKRLLLSSSNRPLQLAGVGLLFLSLLGVAFLLGPREADTVPLAVVDAGAPLLVVVTSPDAGPALVEAEVDAGEIDAGLALAARPEVVDAGEPLAVLRGAGTLGTATTFAPPPKGKPPKVVTTKPTADLTFEGLGTRGSPKKKLKPASKAPGFPAADAPGAVVVAGVGPATVFIGNENRGAAPGEFKVAFGGHGVSVVCNVDGKRQGFKVFLSPKAPSKRLDYQCPES